MAERREVGVDLITRLKDKGLRDLEKGTKRSTKVLGGLEKKLLAVFSVAAISRYSRAAVNAYLQEEKAVRRLSIALTNAGEAVNRFRAEEFIRNLQRTSKVLDSELRPALTTLVNAGVDFEQSQKLLNLALDVSAGTGRDLQTIVQGLSRSYNGNNTALSRLNLGLTKAQLSVAKFEDITTILSLKFQGQASAAANSYEGRLNSLKIAADEAQETIGKALVVSIDRFTGSTQGAEVATEKLSGEIATLILGVGDAAKAFKDFDLENYFDKATRAAKEFIQSGLNPLVAARNFFKGLGEDINLEESLKLSVTNVLPDLRQLQKEAESSRKVTLLYARLAAEAEKKALEAAKKKAAAEAKRAAADKRNATLERLRNSIAFKFDIEAINQQAALRRNISKEDRDRVLQLSALKIADYQTDEEAIKTLEAATTGRYTDAMNLEKVYQLLKQAGFASDQAAIKALDALEPSIDFKDNLDSIIAKLKALIEGKYTISIGATISVPPIPAPGNSASSGIGPGSKFDPGSFRKADEDTSKDLPIIPALPPVIKPPDINLPGEIGGEPAFAARPSSPDVGAFRYFEENESSRLRNLYGAGALPSNFDPSAFRYFEETGFTTRGMATPSFFDPASFRMRDEGVTVNVNVSGSLISQNDLVAAVTDAVYQTQRTGNSLLIAE